MADYHSLLMRAVGNLPSAGTPATRQAIYSRARKALLEQLRSLRPPLPESDIAREETALDAAIAQIEADFAPQEEGAPSVAPSPAAESSSPQSAGKTTTAAGSPSPKPATPNAPPQPAAFQRPPAPAAPSNSPSAPGRSHCVRAASPRAPSPTAPQGPPGPSPSAPVQSAAPQRPSPSSAGSRSARAERNPSTPNSARRQARRRRPSGRRLQSASTARVCRHSRETAAAGRGAEGRSGRAHGRGEGRQGGKITGGLAARPDEGGQADESGRGARLRRAAGRRDPSRRARASGRGAGSAERGRPPRLGSATGFGRPAPRRAGSRRRQAANLVMDRGGSRSRHRHCGGGSCDSDAPETAGPRHQAARRNAGASAVAATREDR